MVSSLSESRGSSQEERIAKYGAIHKPGVGVSLRQYGVPLFASQVNELIICGIDFQRRVLHIRQHLELFNQIAPYAESVLGRTFGNPTPGDRQALIENQEVAYRSAGTRAEIVMESIEELKFRYRPYVS
jgi:hypothetical protein